MNKAGILFVLVMMPLLVGFKQENVQKYSAVTTNPKIIAALNAMDGTSAAWAKKAILGDNLSKKPIIVSFKRLTTISPAYKEFDALGWMGSNGQLYIYISDQHKNAPAEAVASILSHEAVHQDEYSSIHEETYAWGYEADVWRQMKKRNPKLNKAAYNEYPLVSRLNTIEKMFVNANYTTKRIYQEVSTNPGYRNLPLFSPGFSKKVVPKTASTQSTGDLPPVKPTEFNN